MCLQFVTSSETDESPSNLSSKFLSCWFRPLDIDLVPFNVVLKFCYVYGNCSYMSWFLPCEAFWIPQEVNLAHDGKFVDEQLDQHHQPVV